MPRLGKAKSILHKRLKPRQRSVPLARYALKVLYNLAERSRVELESALPASAHATHHTRPFQHAQVLGDGLPRQA